MATRQTKWELQRIHSASLASSQRDAEQALLLYNKGREIQRLRDVLRQVCAPLPLDLLAGGDFKTIAQELSRRIAIAQSGLNGEPTNERTRPAELPSGDTTNSPNSACQAGVDAPDPAQEEVRPAGPNESASGGSVQATQAEETLKPQISEHVSEAVFEGTRPLSDDRVQMLKANYVRTHGEDPA